MSFVIEQRYISIYGQSKRSGKNLFKNIYYKKLAFVYTRIYLYIVIKSETLTHMENIKYKGYIIAEETEPWARIYGIKYVIYEEGQQGPDNESLGFISVDDAKDHIDNNTVES